MLTIEQFQSSVIFLALSSIAVSYIFKAKITKRNDPYTDAELNNIGTKNIKGFLFGLFLVSVGIAIKVAYDSNVMSPNLYGVLDVNRHSSVLEIRKAYKEASKKYHPDKNPDAVDIFREIKTSYDILIDEAQRDIYNRFGDGKLDFDPRKDEFQLISEMLTVYVFWTITSYIATMPSGARASRTWIMIIGIVVMAIEVVLCLTETTMPEWASLNKRSTEYELIYMLHSIFPGLIIGFRCLSEYLYVDVNSSSILVLEDVFQQQENLHSLLQDVQTTLTDANATKLISGQELRIESNKQDSMRTKLVELCDQLEMANESTKRHIQNLKSSNSNPGANYYWILFVILYGGMYFLQ